MIGDLFMAAKIRFFPLCGKQNNAAKGHGTLAAVKL
jgi:hypothetical protein